MQMQIQIQLRVGQIMDDELFSNECGSSNFTNFLKLLGETVQLKVANINININIYVVVINHTVGWEK